MHCPHRGSAPFSCDTSCVPAVLKSFSRVLPWHDAPPKIKPHMETVKACPPQADTLHAATFVVSEFVLPLV